MTARQTGLAERRLGAPAAALTLAVITAVGFGLRLVGLDESLVDDEIFTFDIVTGNDLAGVVDAVRDTSITPPLHYLLAHVSVQLGDAPTTVRLPSIALGTATIPLVYALGSRTVGRPAGLVAAALFALSPFAVWYGVEARAYSTLAFLLVASSYALVRAVGSERSLGWWLLFVAAASGVLYTHYTGVFALAAQAAWACWVAWTRYGRRPLLEVLAAHLAVAIAYAAWIPAYLDQEDNDVGILAIDALHPLNARTAWENVVKLVGGQPFPAWDDLLGPLGLALIALAVLATVAGAFAAARGRPQGTRVPKPTRGAVLIAVLALSTPVGLMAYAQVDTSLYAPRNLFASLPALCLLLGAAVTSVRLPFGAVAATALVAAVAVATVAGLGEDRRRPAYAEVAEYLDREAGPGDAVVVLLALGDSFGRDPARRSLTLELEERHPFLVSAGKAEGAGLAPALDRAAKRRRLFVVVEPVPGVPLSVLRERLDSRFRPVSERVFSAIAPIRVAVYETPAS